MKILITGSNGQLGKTIETVYSQKKYPFTVVFCKKADFDILNPDQLNRVTEDNRIDVIINCAAYTAVDKAEEEKEKSFQINYYGVENLVKTANKYGCHLVHISTDFVFDGNTNKPYRETDQVNPISVYGESKAEGERCLVESCCNYAIFRISWLYSNFGNNFVKTIIRLAAERKQLKVVYDQIGSPTNAYDFANMLLEYMSILYHNKNYKLHQNNIYHFSNEGVTSWYDFSVAIKDMLNLKCDIIPINTEDFPTPAKRPRYTVMDKKLIKERLKITIPHWRYSLFNLLTHIT